MREEKETFFLYIFNTKMQKINRPWWTPLQTLSLESINPPGMIKPPLAKEPTIHNTSRVPLWIRRSDQGRSFVVPLALGIWNSVSVTPPEKEKQIASPDWFYKFYQFSWMRLRTSSYDLPSASQEEELKSIFGGGLIILGGFNDSWKIDWFWRGVGGG